MWPPRGEGIDVARIITPSTECGVFVNTLCLRLQGRPHNAAARGSGPARFSQGTVEFGKRTEVCKWSVRTKT